MKVFLSWSGEESHQVALALKEWLPDVIQAIKPWVSSSDIEKGETWFAAINDSLVNSEGVGVFCLTRTNHEAPWIAFEAGALASRDRSRVATFLHGVNATDIRPPLSLFQATKSADKDDVLLLLETLNRKLEQPLDDGRLRKSFDSQWANLCSKLGGIRPAKPVTPKQGLSTDEVLQELLGVVRRIERDVSAQASIERTAPFDSSEAHRQGLGGLFVAGANEAKGGLLGVFNDAEVTKTSENKLLNLIRMQELLEKEDARKKQEAEQGKRKMVQFRKRPDSTFRLPEGDLPQDRGGEE